MADPNAGFVDVIALASFVVNIGGKRSLASAGDTLSLPIVEARRLEHVRRVRIVPKAAKPKAKAEPAKAEPAKPENRDQEAAARTKKRRG